MSATTKMILAMPAALAARPKKPNTAAISAMTKNAIAQENMSLSYADAFGLCSAYARLMPGRGREELRESTVQALSTLCEYAQCANTRAGCARSLACADPRSAIGWGADNDFIVDGFHTCHSCHRVFHEP